MDLEHTTWMPALSMLPMAAKARSTGLARP